jgi:DNA-binding NtrC family response regulator
MEVLTRVRSAHADVEVVMMTAHADVESAVAAVKAGAYDFLTKPFTSNDAVALAVSQAAERRRLVHRTEALERELANQAGYGSIVGVSARMREVFRLVEGVASANSTVLILGESGTGKELIARAIHERSTRAQRPLVTVNCGAIPADLVESELFGHTRGAFTGATMAREGLFELADRGTIFLDEVGDLPLPAQVKLLRALQEGEVKRVGSNEPRIVDVRVIAATNVDLRTRIRDGKFREDLYYRLNVIPIVVPALRERRDDIPLLATHFLHQFTLRSGRTVSRISPEAMRELERHDWPGNVRELENAIERSVVLARSDVIEPTDLPFGAHVPTASSPPPAGLDGGGVASSAPGTPSYAELQYSDARKKALWDFERRYVDAVLAKTSGNITQAAKLAGLDRSNFKRVLRRIQTGPGDGDTD